MPSPLDYFFKLGDKVTKGDPRKKASFDYYMLWIIFIAFFSILVGNVNQYYITREISKLGWALVMFGILWFQYFALKTSHEARKLMEGMEQTPKDNEVDSVKEMMEE